MRARVAAAGPRWAGWSEARGLPPSVIHMPHKMEQYLEGRTLILLSNREPYEHVRAEGDAGPDDAAAVTLRRPPGGLVSALDPTMQRTHGTWVAWGSGSADREHVDEHARVMVPPEDPSYTLRRVWLVD